MRQEDTHAVCGQGIREASRDNVSIIGLDISKTRYRRRVWGSVYVAK